MANSPENNPTSRYSAERIGELRSAIKERIPTVEAVARRTGQSGLSPRFLKSSAAELLRAELEGAAIDELTGLARRNEFMRQTEPLAAEVRRYPDLRLLEVDHVDVDNFAPFNRAYGQRQGDTALRTLGGIIRGEVRDTDTSGRIGGEEFAVGRPIQRQMGPSREEPPIHPAERLRIAIAESGLGEGDAHLTVSVGTTEFLPDEELADAMDRADRAHLIAKMLGKNMTVSSSINAGGHLVHQDLTHGNEYIEGDVDGVLGLVSRSGERFQIIIDSSGALKPYLQQVS